MGGGGKKFASWGLASRQPRLSQTTTVILTHIHLLRQLKLLEETLLQMRICEPECRDFTNLDGVVGEALKRSTDYNE